MTASSLSHAIEQRRFSGFHVELLLLCATLMFLDGFNLAAQSFVTPALIREWGISKAVLGIAFSAGFAGQFVGAGGLSMLADRFGRRPLLLGCAVSFGVFSLMSSLVDTIWQLALLRFLSGVALGGAVPNAIALMAEYAPRARRAQLIILMMIGYTLGQAGSGLLSAYLLANEGWRSVFFVGGVAPLILSIVLWLRLPESLVFNVNGVRPTKRADQTLRRLFGANAELQDFHIETHTTRAVPLLDLFRTGFAAKTLLLWLGVFCNVGSLYLLSSWLPSVLVASGSDAARAASASSFFSIGGAAASLFLSFFADRSGAALIGSCCLTAALAIGTFEFIGPWLGLQTAWIFLMGFGIIGGQAVINAVSGVLYPASIKATGVGWALATGRVGAIIGPSVGGWLLGSGASNAAVFRTAALPEVIGALAFLVLARLLSRTSATAGRETSTQRETEA